MSEALEVGNKVAALLKEGKFEEIYKELYSADIVSSEPSSPSGDPTSHGIEAVMKKGDEFMAVHEIHSMKIEGPFPHGDEFILYMDFDVTNKHMGARFNLVECALYKVAGGKIVHERFFYHMG